MTMWRKVRHFIKREEGNVLYLTLIMLMILIMTAAVLIHVIQIAVIKIKAQQAADQMVLSAATLKARLLNNFANKNSYMLGVLQKKGTRETPFANAAEARRWKSTLENLTRSMSAETKRFSRAMSQSGMLINVARNNGLDEESSRVRLYPLDIKPDRDLRIITKQAWILKATPPYYTPIDLPAGYEPMVPLAVQARVEWKSGSDIIGYRWLKSGRPAIITRARAEIYDAGVLRNPAARCWRVRLVPPLANVDEYLKNQ